MSEIIEQREQLLGKLVALKSTYSELCSMQQARFSAISLKAIPDHRFLHIEETVFEEEIAFCSSFLQSITDFPEFQASPTTVVSKPSEKSKWFFFGKEPEVLVEMEDPDAAEANVQSSRLTHLCDEWIGALQARRELFEHASFEARKLVVTLNDAGRAAIDGIDQISRDRHFLESFVTLLCKASANLLVLSRKLEDAKPVPMNPASQDLGDAEGYALSGEELPALT